MAEIYDELATQTARQRPAQESRRAIQEVQRGILGREIRVYGLCIGWREEKVLSVVSNVGQCLWSGIIAPERAGKVVKRLMREDMWSGWGIRTLSADHPSFNPYNYQTGRLAARQLADRAGMRRYGFAAEAAAVARDISRAASHLLLNQLPELYGGLQRDATNSPVQISAQMCRRPGRPGPHSCCCRRCWGCSRMHPAQAVCRPRAAGLAAGRRADGSSAGQAALRYPLLAGRQGHGLQGVEGEARCGERMSMTLSGTIADR